MPFDAPSGLDPTLRGPASVAPGSRPRARFGELVAAGVRTESDIAALGRMGGRWADSHLEPLDPLFDPITAAQQDEFWTPYIPTLARARNPNHYRRLQAGIMQELEDKALLSGEGLRGYVGALIGSGASLTNLIGGPAAAGARNVGRAALRGGAAVGAITAGQEALLHASQTDRTVEESLLAIGGASLVGAALGSWAKRIEKRELATVIKAFEAEESAAAAFDPTIRNEARARESIRPFEIDEATFDQPTVRTALRVEDEADSVDDWTHNPDVIPGFGGSFWNRYDLRRAYAKASPAAQAKGQRIFDALDDMDRIVGKKGVGILFARAGTPGLFGRATVNANFAYVDIAVGWLDRTTGDRKPVAPGDVAKTIYHETLHVARHTGVVGPEDWDRLVTSVTDEDVAKLRARSSAYDDLEPESVIEEVLAFRFEQWERGEPVEGWMAKLFQRISETMAKVGRRWREAVGQRSAKDVFDDLQQGLLLDERNRTGRSQRPTLDVEPMFKRGSAAPDKLEQEGLKPTGLKLEKIPASPFVRLLNSSFEGARTWGWALAEAPGFYQVKNALGMASEQSVETKARRWQARSFEVINHTQDAWLRYRGANQAAPLRERARIAVTDRHRPTDRLTFQQFREAVGEAMHRGDQHPIAEVAEAAAEWRKLFDELADEAESIGLFGQVAHSDAAGAAKEARKAWSDVWHARMIGSDPEAIKELVAKAEQLDARAAGIAERMKGSQKGQLVEGETYFPHMWRHDKIEAELTRFEQIIRDWLRNKGVSKNKLDEATRATVNQILHQTPWKKIDDPDATGKASGLHTRLIDIPFEQIKDFLDLDVEYVGRLHARTMGTDVELAKRFGDVAMSEQLLAVDDWAANTMRKQLKAVTSGDNAERMRIRRGIEKERDAIKRDLRGLRDRVRGTYGLPDDPFRPLSRFYRIAKQANAMMMLGSSTISALVDAARPVMVEGLGRTFGVSLAALSRGLDTIKLGRREAHLAGVALDVAMGTRAFAFADVSDVFGRRASFDRMMTDATGRFFILNGMNHWTAAMKEWSAMVVSSRVLDTAKRIGNATMQAGDHERLLRSGIDDEMAGRIAAQFDQHGELVDGKLYMPNTEAWEDLDAVWAFRQAVAQDVDRIIVTPGAADRPLWMSTEFGSVLSQFKAFGVASTQRVLIAGLQDPNRAAFVYGAAMLVAMGFVSDRIRDQTKGPGGYKARNWRERLSGAVDRSGLLGWFGDVNNLTETLTSNRVGLRPLVGAEKPFKPSLDFALGSLGGPTASTMINIMDVAADWGSGTHDRWTAHALRKLMFGNNLWWATRSFDAVEESLR